MIRQEQVKVNELIFEYDQPGLGRVRQARAAARFDDTPTGTEHLAPQLGEHGAEVLREHGFTDDEITTLVDSGVMHGPAADT